MTDQEWIDLGKRAVACKGWRWMPGMLATSTNNYHRPARIESLDGDAYGLTVVPHAEGPVFAAHHEYGIAGEFPRGSTIPDLRDPATVGCLLSLVREAHPGCSIWVARDCVVDPLDDTEYMLDEREGWTVCGGSGDDYLSPYGSGDSEAAALVAALEAAP